MNRNLIIICSIFISVIFFACKKETQKPVDPPATSKAELLASKVWKYNEYFIEYNKPNTVLAYKLGKQNNLYDLSKCRLTFGLDLKYSEISESGSQIYGTWRFIENESKIEVAVNQQVYVHRVVSITTTNFSWINSEGDVLARMIPE